MADHNAGDAKWIMLKVVDQDSNEVHLYVEHGSSMGNLKNSYAEMKVVAITQLLFLFGGRRINDDDTPKSLKMKEDDVIEVYQVIDSQAMAENNAGAAEYIMLKVDGHDGNVFHILVKNSTLMGKLINWYADRTGMKDPRFLFDGRLISNIDTPKSLEMEEDDVIEMYKEQLGGP